MASKKGSKDNPISATTKAPKDLKIDLNTTISSVVKRMTFSASWTCADDNYDAGQQFYWKRSGKQDQPDAAYWKNKVKKRYARGHAKAKIDKSDHSITFAELLFSDFWPVNTGENNKVRWIKIWVRGQKAKYKVTKKNKDTWYDPKWSSYSMRVLHIKTPPKPVIAEPAAGASDFEKIFTWTVPQSSSYAVDSTSRKNRLTGDNEQYEVFYRSQWESILTQGDEYTEDMWTDGNHSLTTGNITPGELEGTATFTENPSGWGAEYSYTRRVRVRSQGPAGDSDWVYKEFIYSQAPAPPAPKSANLSYDSAGNPIISINDEDQLNQAKYPVKYTILQSSSVVPITSLNVTTDSAGNEHGVVTFSPPAENDASWTDIKKVPGTGSVSGRIDTFAADNKVVWTRVVRVDQGDNLIKGSAKMCMNPPDSYPLSNPTALSITNVNPTTARVTVSATNNASDIAASYLLVYYRNSARPDTAQAIGIIPHGETSATVQLPHWGETQIDIGVQAIVADYDSARVLLDSETQGMTYKTSVVKMQSDIVWKGGDLPLPPTGLNLSIAKAGTIRATWDWTWAEADQAEISWADHEDAWESTSQPNTYVISNTNTGQWNISDLAVGEWWVRVRFIKTEGESTTYGMYSAAKSIKVVSTPEVPYLTVTPKVITPDGSVTLTWVYTSEDGEGQKTVEIARDEDHSRILYKGSTESSVTLTRDKLIGGWGDNETVTLAIQVTSNENVPSGWSKSATFNVAPLPAKPVVTFTQGFVQNKSLTVGDETISKDCVVSLPLNMTISNVAAAENVKIIIERAKGNIVERPDESDYPVYAGDLVYLDESLTGQTSYLVSIDQDDLIDYLDDDHDYILRVINTDKYDQSNSTEVPFRVYWTHQAIKPTATVLIDRDNYTASITPIRPISGYVAGDTVDIYRLSADKPQLVFAKAELTNPPTVYIDPFPTIGEFGGYRVVYKTVNGDYRMGGANGNYAMTDYDANASDDYIIDDFVSIINFGRNLTDQVILRYDLSLSHAWKKDFIETQYLGGSVQGDWNPGVSRTGSIKATVSIFEDPFLEDPTVTLESMRRLAVYPGVCHIRTPDGSTYYANVDVNEDREEKLVKQLGKFSLSITRVDPPTSFEEGSTAEDDEADEDEE